MAPSYLLAYQKKLVPLIEEKKIRRDKAEELLRFIEGYLKAVPLDEKSHEKHLVEFVEKVVEEVKNPLPFDYYHRAERAPFDYYQFGVELIRPLVILAECRRKGIPFLEKVIRLVTAGENVIFIANHQIEPDPQAISLLLEPEWSHFAEEMIFVAGHRVLQDPLARPLSRGRHLLTIFSRKYMESPPEEKNQKLFHNQKTLTCLKELLDGGGKAIYVAMSGGRDRPDEMRAVIPAALDPSALELFLLLAKESKKKTHFFPLALATYALFPPPNELGEEIGESRHVERSAIHIGFGPEILFDEMSFPECGKKQAREKRAMLATEIIRKLYASL